MIDMDPNWFYVAWQIGATVVGCVGGVVGMWASLHFAKRRDLDALKSTVTDDAAEQDQRLTRIEEQLRQAPKHADLVALAQGMSELASRVSRLEGQTERTNSLLQVIHDHLLNEK